MAGATIDNINIVATADVSSAIKSLDKLQEKLSGLKGAATKAAPAVKSTEKSIESAGKTASHASGGISKLAAAIKRVVVYRMLRGAIKAITNAFSEGTKNAYAWADANNDAFKQVMDTYATRTAYLKNSLGAMASTLLTTLQPAFMTITGWLIKGINYVNEFIAAIKGALTGDYSYLKAKEVAVEFAESTDDAAKAQKRLNQQLMAFDELNVITTPRDTARGSGDAGKWDDAFERTEVSDWMKNNLGWVVAGTLATVIAAHVGAGLLKGLLVTPAVTSAIGKVGSALSTALTAAAGVVITIRGIKNAWDAGGALADDDYNTAIQKGVLGLFEGALGGALVGHAFGKTALGLTIGLELSFIATLAGFLFDRDSARKMFSGFWDELKSIFNTGHGTSSGNTIPKFCNGTSPGNTIPKFGNGSAEWFGDVGKDVNKISGGTIGKVGDWVHDVFSGIGTAVGSVFGETKPPVLSTINGMISGFGSGAKKQSSNTTSKLFASGGYPSMGSIFVAGEVPGSAEMVGNINGRTGVASGEEITGISEAVYSTGGETNALLRELIAVSSGGTNRPSAAFGKFVSQSLNLYKGVTG